MTTSASCTAIQLSGFSWSRAFSNCAGDRGIRSRGGGGRGAVRGQEEPTDKTQWLGVGGVGRNRRGGGRDGRGQDRRGGGRGVEGGFTRVVLGVLVGIGP